MPLNAERLNAEGDDTGFLTVCSCIALGGKGSVEFVRSTNLFHIRIGE